MARWRPDPTFYASPTLAANAPAEQLAYVAMIAAGGNGKRDAIGVVDVDPSSPSYGRLVGQTDLPTGDNELHHFGWNACSSHLCPYAPHAHVERRYLVVPGTGSSRIHILDTQPDPKNSDWVSVRVEPVRPLARPVTLAEIKAEPRLAKMEPIRQSRLSVAPVRDEEWNVILELARAR